MCNRFTARDPIRTPIETSSINESIKTPYMEPQESPVWSRSLGFPSGILGVQQFGDSWLRIGEDWPW